MKLRAADRRKVKRLKHWLVAHSNLIVMLGDAKRDDQIVFPGVTRADVEKERKKIWNRLIKADTRLLQIASRELDAQEMRWQMGEI
jgi:hypothetical protein